jgi:transposase
MYIQRNKKSKKSGGHYESALLCHKFRENGKIKTKVLANLSMLPADALLSLENSLKANQHGQTVFLEKDISVEKVIDFGFFFIIYTLLENLRIAQLFDTLLPKQTAIIKLVIIGKIITRGSKLEIFNWIKRNPFFAQIIGVELDTLKLNDIYQVVGQLPQYQDKIEKKWGLYNKASEKEIFLYDITSSYFEGVKNSLAAFGYNRDGKSGKMQITIGLITDSFGFPLKIEVFEGNENDHKTVVNQLKALKENFKAEKIIFVGDRGMKIRYNLEQMTEIERTGIEYITGLTKEEIKSLVKNDTIQLSLFSRDLVEVTDNNTRYILSQNPELAKEKTKFRNILREKFENKIHELQQSWQKRYNKNLENKEKLEKGHKNKKLVTEFRPEQIESFKKRMYLLCKKYKMNTYYSITISCDEFKIDFNLTVYNNDKNLDGLYVLATNVKAEKLDKKQIRAQYKNLQHVEHAFRDMKSVRINVRPIFHVNEATTRGHILCTMFSYAIIYTIEQSVFPLLKEINKKLSYKVIEDELKQIKIVEYNLGKKVQKIQVTKLTELQQKVFKSLKMKENDLLKFEKVATNRKKNNIKILNY